MKNLQTSEATEWRKIVAHGVTVGFVVKPESAPKPGERNVWRLIFCRPFRGLDFLFAIQPTVAPWATICRAPGALLVLAAILFCTASAKAQITNGLSDSEIKGRDLARQLCDGKPIENFKNFGTLKIRDGHGVSTNFPLKFFITISPSYWNSIYQVTRTNVLNNGEKYPAFDQFVICHFENQNNSYLLGTYGADCFEETVHQNIPGVERYLSVSELARPFSNSDFWLCDLGLEFFHWPQQKILPKTTNLKRGREYTLLESTNPNPTTNGYSRVLSWIDKESGGILEAEAYDFNGKLLKDFAPKSFKKVNGQWELQEMEIRNVQTGSRTRLEFDLKKN